MLYKIWSRVLVFMGLLSLTLISGKASANSMQGKYGVLPADAPLLYGVAPVTPAETIRDLISKYLLYIAAPAVIIVLIIIGIKKFRKKPK